MYVRMNNVSEAYTPTEEGTSPDNADIGSHWQTTLAINTPDANSWRERERSPALICKGFLEGSDRVPQSIPTRVGPKPVPGANREGQFAEPTPLAETQRA